MRDQLIQTFAEVSAKMAEIPELNAKIETLHSSTKEFVDQSRTAVTELQQQAATAESTVKELESKTRDFAD